MCQHLYPLGLLAHIFRPIALAWKLSHKKSVKMASHIPKTFSLLVLSIYQHLHPLGLLVDAGYALPFVPSSTTTDDSEDSDEWSEQSQ